MDSRFVRAWRDVEARRHAGEPMPRILRHMRTPELIAALAGVGPQDPVAANALATELLNREARAPFLGVAIASAAFAVGVFLVDAILTGSALHLLTTVRTSYVMAGLSFVSAILSFVTYATWRGRFPWLGRALRSFRRSKSF